MSDSHDIQPGSLTGPPVPSAHDAATSFFRTEAFGSALARTRFTVDEEVRMLVGFMRDVDAKVALAAQAAFRRTLTQVATADGMIGKQTMTVRDGSRRLSVSRSVLPPLPSEEHPDDRPAPDFAATYLPPVEAPRCDRSLPGPDAGGCRDRG